MRFEAERWLNEALYDLETAKILHREKRWNAACFYSQQAAEKAAKALLYFINQSPWGHSIVKLLERFSDSTGEDLSKLYPKAMELDRLYMPSRYPNMIPEKTPHEVFDKTVSERAVKYAEEIIEFARQRIKKGN